MCFLFNGTGVYKIFENTIWLPLKTPLGFHWAILPISGARFHRKCRQMTTGPPEARMKGCARRMRGGRRIGTRVQRILSGQIPARTTIYASLNQRFYTVEAFGVEGI
jgi:hypothetical protein